MSGEALTLCYFLVFGKIPQRRGEGPAALVQSQCVERVFNAY